MALNRPVSPGDFLVRPVSSNTAVHPTRAAGARRPPRNSARRRLLRPVGGAEKASGSTQIKSRSSSRSGGSSRDSAAVHPKAR